MGDDLKLARDFADAASTEMDWLLSDFRLDADRAQAALIRLQSGAKSIQARGIYRAAQSVLESYYKHQKQPTIDGRLMALYKLVVQYTEGLNEIAPLQSDTIAAQIEDAEAVLADDNPQIRFETAKDTLMPLLKYAGEYEPALQQLAGLNITAIPTLSPQVSFETLMPEVTNQALRAARIQGKSVSISYASDELKMPDSQVDKVREQLEHIIEDFVRRKIETPERRQSKGLSRGGHIDISASQSAKGLDIAVLCDGETVRLLPQSDIAASRNYRADEVVIDMKMEALP